MGWGSGSVEFPVSTSHHYPGVTTLLTTPQYLIAPLDAIRTRAQQDGTSIATSTNDNAQQGASVAQNVEYAIVCINADSGEGYIEVEGNTDRKNLDPCTSPLP